MIERLKPYIKEKPKKYTNKVIPNSKPSLGIYTKDLKLIAKEMVSNGEFNYFNCIHETYEEDMLHVFMITYIKDWDYVLECLSHTIPKINNWAMCDQLITNLKIVKKHKKEMLAFVDKYKNSDNEYEVRFVLVTLLGYYCDSEHAKYIFEVIDNCNKKAYYVKMAIAWLLCEMFIKVKNETYSYLLKCKLDKWIINKAIQKMKESFRISDEEKKYLNDLKIK